MSQPEVEPGVLPPALRRAWGATPPKGTRGRRASLDIETIIRRAVEVADAGGVGALSLVRLAEILDVTPNALYRYLESREELDVLLREYALAQPPIPAPTDDWRSSTREWAHQLRARYLDHPWLADLRLTVPITPNALGWLEALLAALEASPLDPSDTIRAATVLDGYVRAHFISQRNLSTWSESPLGEAELAQQVAPLIEGRGYDHVATLFRTGLYQEPTNATHERDFEFGLERILLGLAARP